MVMYYVLAVNRVISLLLIGHNDSYIPEVLLYYITRLSLLTPSPPPYFYFQTLTASFARAGNNLNSPGLAPPWTSSTSTISSFAHGGGDSPGETSGRAGVDHEAKKSIATITPKSALAAACLLPPSSRESDDASETDSDNEADGEVDEIVHALKLAVVNVVRHLEEDDARLPLRNRTMAVLVDGSRMSMLALELASAAWKFGRREGKKIPSNIHIV